MKRWTSINKITTDERWQLLSQTLIAKGAANEFVPWKGAPEVPPDISVLNEFNHVRLSSSLAAKMLKQVKIQSSWVTLLGVIDGMVRTNEEWWPLCAMYEAFGQILIRDGQDLDMKASVLVAGAGSAAHVAIAAFFKSGFHNFIVTNINGDEGKALVREVKSRFFGMQIQFLPMDRIVLLPGESAVAVNCTPSVKENSLITELTYLNFLKRPGYLFDLNLTAKPSLLVAEAADAGVRVIDGIELAARTDVLWAEWAFKVKLDLDSYRESLRATLK